MMGPRGAVLCGVILLVGSWAGTGTPSPSIPSLVIKSLSSFYPGKSSLNLPYAIAGQGSFTLLVSGAGFTTSSIVRWNGSSLPTTFGDSTDLVAEVSSSLIALPGKAAISVSDSGKASNAVSLPIASPATATAGVVGLITVAPDGSPANGDTLVRPSISATGRFVAFQSSATNLVPGSPGGYQEIYERDTCIGASSGCTPGTIRITVAHDGSPVNAHSRNSAISADGRYVGFDSSATNILPETVLCSRFDCVFLRDTCVGARLRCIPATTLISIGMDGSPAGGESPAMTPDGRFVAFNSTGKSPGITNVYVRDTCNGAPLSCIPNTRLVSASSSGSGGTANSFPQAISATGRHVAFESYATNLVSGATVVPGIFLRDTCIGSTLSCRPVTVRVDVGTNRIQPNSFATADPPAVDNKGRLVAFGSASTNLIAPGVNRDCAGFSGCAGVYVRDTCNGEPIGCTPGTILISMANDGAAANCSSPGNNGGISLSADGRFVAFASIATNLTPDDNFSACAWEDIFVRDTCFGVTNACHPSTVRVSVANTPNPGISANAISIGNAMSADGHYVAFISAATNLSSGTMTNGHALVYLAKTGF